MQKVRFGVVGTNFITDWLIKGGREDARFELAAVCSRSQETAMTFAAKHNIPYVFTSIEELAASKHVDAVYIATPNAFHSYHSIVCMEQGKHVLCEKAFASNSAEVRKMIDIAHRNNVVLMEAMKPTLTPAFKAVIEEKYRVGMVRQYFSCYCQYSSRYDKLKENIVLNAFNPSLSNGAVMDIGVYTIYPMVVLFGRPTTIKATGVKLSSGVDGNGSVVFGYDNKLTANVIYSKISDSQLPTEIQGEEGSIIFDRINIIGSACFKSRNGNVLNIMPETSHDEYYYEVAEFINLIQSGKIESDINSHANSLITIEIIDEIRRQTGILFDADKK